MKVYDFKVLLEPDDEVGGYVVTCPSLPGCYTQGDTIDEAIENIKEAILLCLDDLQAQNVPLFDNSKTLISSVAVAIRAPNCRSFQDVKLRVPSSVLVTV